MSKSGTGLAAAPKKMGGGGGGAGAGRAWPPASALPQPRPRPLLPGVLARHNARQAGLGCQQGGRGRGLTLSSRLQGEETISQASVARRQRAHAVPAAALGSGIVHLA
jgi:hypothetical protein